MFFSCLYRTCWLIAGWRQHLRSKTAFRAGLCAEVGCSGLPGGVQSCCPRQSLSPEQLRGWEAVRGSEGEGAGSEGSPG